MNSGVRKIQEGIYFVVDTLGYHNSITPFDLTLATQTISYNIREDLIMEAPLPFEEGPPGSRGELKPFRLFFPAQEPDEIEAVYYKNGLFYSGYDPAAKVATAHVPSGPPSCTCGSGSVGGLRHSDWCDKA